MNVVIPFTVGIFRNVFSAKTTVHTSILVDIARFQAGKWSAVAGCRKIKV
jgi:hypothetical protein